VSVQLYQFSKVLLGGFKYCTLPQKGIKTLSLQMFFIDLLVAH